jgi:hypothetical protein
MDVRYLLIGKEPFKKTKEFMKLLYRSDIPDRWIKFDKLDCSISWSRQHDPDMTFAEYMKHASGMVSFMIGQKNWKQGSIEDIVTISLVMRNVYLPDSPNVERFYWWFCPLNDSNYAAVKELFKQAYDKDMDDYE